MEESMLSNINGKGKSDKTPAVGAQDVEIYAGNTLLVDSSVLNLGDNIKILTVESMDTNIASVCGSFVIGNNVGKAQILIKAASDSDIYDIVMNVSVIPGKLTVEPDTRSISVGETTRYKAMVSNGVYKSISYQSTNLNVAAVRQEGIYGYVTGMAEGNADILITANIGNTISEFKIPLKVVEASKPAEIPISNPVNGSGYTDDDEWKGSRVFFGRYEQDNNIKNGKEPILWRVLEVNDDTIFLLSEYGLVCRFYNDTYESVTWETSTIRRWLNSTFLESAFLKPEIDAICDTVIKTKDNKRYGSCGGNKTVDKVFLLTSDDVNNTAYGFQKGSKRKSKTRTCRITEYALVEGYRNKDNNNTCWWLRSPGITNYYAAYVLSSGKVTYGYFVGRRNDAVRPAIKLKRSAVIFGEEISDGKYTAPLVIAKEF